MFSCCITKNEDVKGDVLCEEAVPAVDDTIPKGAVLQSGKSNLPATAEEPTPVEVSAEVEAVSVADEIAPTAAASALPAAHTAALVENRPTPGDAGVATIGQPGDAVGLATPANVEIASAAAPSTGVPDAGATRAATVVAASGAAGAITRSAGTVTMASAAADTSAVPDTAAAPQMPAFLKTATPLGEPWGEYVAAAGAPAFARGKLVGAWAECVCAGILFERKHEGWESMPGYEDDGPVGQIIAYLEACGHGKHSQKLEKAEEVFRELGDKELEKKLPGHPVAKAAAPVAVKAKAMGTAKAKMPAFLKTLTPLGEPWGEHVAAAGAPAIERGALVGAWAECVCAGILFERKHEGWDAMPGYEDDGPVGQIIAYLETCGHGKHSQTLEKAEEVFRELGDKELEKKLPGRPFAKAAAPAAVKAKAKGKAKAKAKPLPPMGAFLKRAGPDGATWGQYVARFLPKLDEHGELSGRWLECIRAGVAFEFAHPNWESMPEYADGPCGQIIHFAEKLGLGKYEDALHQAEERAREDPDVLQVSGGPSVPADVGAFMQLLSPDGQSWAQFCARAGAPEIDEEHRLRGPWLDCLMSAVQFEFDNPAWEQMPGYSEGPVGHVIQFVIDMGHGSLQQDFERAEEEIRAQQVPPGAGFGIHPMVGSGMPHAGPGSLEAEIMGHGMQAVEVTLNGNEQIVAEPGALLHVEEELQLETRCPPGADTGTWSKIKGAFKRLVVGESVFMMLVTNMCGGGLHAAPKRKVAFAAPLPGQIVEIDLAQYGGSLVVQRGAYVCGSPSIEMTIAFQGFIGGLFGGEGFVMCRLQGHGTAFFHCGGCIVRKELAPGASLRVDTGCLAAHTDGVNVSITKAGGIKSMFFGGEGLFLAHLQAPPQGGVVWIQSCPTVRLAARLLYGG